MKGFRRWQRISILFLLTFSVFAPLVFISNKLKTLTSEGRIAFVEDLSSIKHRRELLPLNAVQQETRQGVKEPKPEIYRDQNYPIVSISGNGYGSSNFEYLQTGGNRRTYASERSGTDLGLEEEAKPMQAGEDPVNRRTNQLDYRVRAPHVQDSHTNTQKITDSKVKQMKDQVIRAQVYLSFASSSGNTRLVKELRLRVKEVERAMGDGKRNSELSRSDLQKMKVMEFTLSKASRTYPDCSKMIDKLRAMIHRAEDQVVSHRNLTTFLTELAGRTTPKSLHCLSMRLTTEYFALEPEQQVLHSQQSVYSPDFLHYVVFSDNILAATVVVNSTVSNAMEPEKIVFHVVTDSLNYFSFLMWFLLNPPGKATIEVLNANDFQWLSPMLASSLEKQNSLDPRFSSPLNHLRFYLPEIFPHLSKVVFLDHDVVVQKDLRGLWAVDMKGKVNGAVETCQESDSSYRQMDMLINFSDPLVAKKYDINACTWAFGMNLFDLRQWRQQDLTSTYRRFLLRGNERSLWTAGSLPLGWLTFYGQTVPLDWRWHLLGLGYDSQVSIERLESAAVIHYDGIMKPWLDIGIKKYKRYWNKYVNCGHPYLEQCNLHG